MVKRSPPKTEANQESAIGVTLPSAVSIAPRESVTVKNVSSGQLLVLPNGQDRIVEPVEVPPVGAPMPKSIGLCADDYAAVRAIRLRMEKEVEAVKARESEIREHIISNLSKSDDTGAAGLKYRAQIVMKTKPKLSDWALLTQCVAETGRFDFLQKRLGEKAVEDMWEQGFDIPGIERMNIPDVSITKI